MHVELAASAQEDDLTPKEEQGTASHTQAT